MYTLRFYGPRSNINEFYQEKRERRGGGGGKYRKALGRVERAALVGVQLPKRRRR